MVQRQRFELFPVTAPEVSASIEWHPGNPRPVPTLGGPQQLSTTWDLAIFGQAFLNGGTYGGARVLSPASVVQMTQNHVAGVLTQPYAQLAAHGFGWVIHAPGAIHPLPIRLSDRAFGHGGSGGSLLCVDPARELVVVWLSIWPDDSGTTEGLIPHEPGAAERVGRRIRRL